MYQLGDNLKVRRCGEKSLELEIGGERTVISTEDLAQVVSMELPADRANEMFAEVQERAIKRGKVHVQVKAEKDIKKHDIVSFMLDIARYVGDSDGVRTTPSGIMF